MLLAVDVGNTNTILGLYHLTTDENPAELIHDWRITTPHGQTLDEIGVTLRSLFAAASHALSEVDGIVISSVVPPLDTTLRLTCESFFQLKPLFIEPGVKTGLPVLVDNPAEVGADRIANSVAAFDRYGGPTIVVDMGTATNFDVVSARGEFLGGAIAPGLGVAADALFDRTARLPRIDIRKPVKIIGTGTVDNLQIGLYYGYIGLVDGILRRMIAELGPETKTIATGGLARLIAPGSEYLSIVDDMLTLTGLRLIYEKNQDRRLSRRPQRPLSAAC